MQVSEPNDAQDKEQFLHPKSRYYGEFTPKNLAFNANLQEFASRVALICSLETGGKISPEEAYHRIKQLWSQLQQSKRYLLDHEQSEGES
jgi:hypothetical protein